ncbi:MAG: dienelactone hydrolase family protein [Segniliparus sp.]|uniref:dienelactone hydrolase family protein n=1 Tax=Segniliparus sp. TaxID=2804064 RepID=UPI003F3D4F6C
MSRTSTPVVHEWAFGPTPVSVYMPTSGGHSQDSPVVGLVVVHDALGAWSAIRRFAAEAAQLGYFVAVPHLYHRAGSPVFESAENFDDIRPLLAGLTGDGIAEDVSAAISLLRQKGAHKVAVTGFCMGGTVALYAAANLPVDAAVTYYGGALAEERWPGVESGLASAGKLRAPWLGVYGSLDKGNPPEVLDLLDQARAHSSAPSSVAVLRGVDHAFSIGEGVFPSYAPQEAALAHQLGWDFLARMLG